MTQLEGNAWRTPGPWVGLTIGTAAPILALASAGAIGTGLAAGLMIVPLALAIQVVRTIRNPVELQVYGSEAMRTYNKRMLVASMAYAAGVMCGVGLYNNAELSGPLAFVAALLPTIPALAMVWAMGRYLTEETDEYLRHRASLSAMIGLGFVLVAGTVWGFMETFGVAPHVWAWWVVPIFAIGLGIGQVVISRNERSQGDDE
ncbi:hypothetical protein NAP1_13748 [Erythrobacter sp. NAP1]|uniref:hypothetical protein n=1 Tax=Erythrobacter sp. NAP1 TaxID=237727 RepID=UPI000068762A|nr:hypothetical protein [Erythrobacter sp. NAP1]EAQ28667.1 hypothetical protein NAP1_13748 [Erythrobacter sp. NAP1]